MTENNAEIIRRIYDLVLHPENHDEFLAYWEEYISEFAQPYSDLKNSQHESEILLQDDKLEEHFRRAHAILNKTDRENIEANNDIGDEPGLFLFQFDRSGVVRQENPKSNSIFRNIKTASDLADAMEIDSASRWLKMLSQFKTSPTVGKFEIFSLESNGNIVAFGRRNIIQDEIRIVVQQLTIGWSEQLDQVLKSSFGVTDKETELLQSLIELGSLNAVSENDQRSKHTLRAQLKSIFQKTRTKSQPELMQCIATLANICQRFDYEDDIHSGHIGKSENENYILRNGDLLPVYFFGPETGTPVIFIHGMMDGVGITREIENILENKNIRLIAPIRPGFGGAGPCKSIKDAPDYFAEHLCDLADILKLQKFFLIGHMSGSVYSYAATKKLNSKILGIINISGGVPTLSAKQFSVMAPRQKAFAYTARFAPQLFPVLMRAGVSQIDAMKTDELLDSMYLDGSVDKIQVFANKPIKDLITAGYRFSVAQGYKGFEADAYHVTRDWSVFVKNCDVPVLQLHGKYDPVVNIKFVHEFSEQYGTQLVEFEEDGQLIFYLQPQRVFSEIAKFITANAT